MLSDEQLLASNCLQKRTKDVQMSYTMLEISVAKVQVAIAPKCTIGLGTDASKNASILPPVLGLEVLPHSFPVREDSCESCQLVRKSQAPP